MLTIELDLSRHCVLSEIRRIYNQAVNDCFRSPDREKLEETIETLKAVLEQVDLAELRGKFPQLAGQNRAAVRLEVREGREMCLIVDGQVVFRRTLR